RARQQHSVAEVPPAALVAEHRGEEQPLVDLEPALVALDQAILGGELLRGRKEARHEVGGADHQLLDAHETRAAFGYGVVDGLCMTLQKTAPGVPRLFLNEARRGLLAPIAPRLLRHPPPQARPWLAVVGGFLAIGGKNSRLARVRPPPRLLIAR